MGIFRTDRPSYLNTVTIPITGHLAFATVWSGPGGTPPFVSAGWRNLSDIQCIWNPSGVYNPNFHFYSNPTSGPPHGPYPESAWWRFDLDAGFGNPSETATTGQVFMAYDAPIASLNGSATITFYTDQWVSTGAPSHSDSNGFPTFGTDIDALPMGYDAPPGLNQTYFETFTALSRVTLSVTILGTTLTVFHDLLAGQEYAIVYDIQSNIEGFNSLNALGTSGPGIADTVSAVPFWNGIRLDNPYKHSQSGITLDCTSGPSVVIDAPTTAQGSHEGTLSADLTAPKIYAINFAVNKQADAYPGSVPIRIQDTASHVATFPVSGGSGVFNGRQDIWDISGGFNLSVGGPSAPASSGNNWGPIACWLAPSFFTGSPSEDSSNWRICFRSNYFAVGDVSQSAGASPDASPTVANWSAGSHTAVANGGGGVQATVDSTGPGSFSRTFANVNPGWLGTSFAGYRYLRLYLTGDAASLPARVTLTNPYPAGSIVKYWDVTCPQGSAPTPYVDIDLCSPGNMSVTTDAFDTRYPLSGPGTPRAVQDSPYWGVSNVSSLSISNLSANHTYTLTSVQLVRKDHSRLNILPAYNSWVDSHEDDEDGSIAAQYRNMFLRCETDYRTSYEGRDWYRQDDGTGTFSYTFLELTQLIGFSNEESNTNGGWNSTPVIFPPTGCSVPQPPLVNCYLSNHLPATYLMGAGMRYTAEGSETAASWKSCVDFDVSSSKTLYAQVMPDEIDFHPGCVDPFHFLASGSTETRMQLAAAKQLGGSSWGIVLQSDGTPADMIKVHMQDHLTSATAGDATTDALGGYATEIPYGVPNRDYDTEAQSGSLPFPTVTRKHFAPKRSRACFRVSSNPTYKAIDRDSERGRFHISAEKAIRLYNSQTFVQQYASGDYDVDSWVRFRYDKRRSTLLALSIKGSVFGLWLSTDGGVTATEVTSLTAKSAVIEVDSERGLFLFMYTDNSNNAFISISTDGGQTWQTGVPMRMQDSSQINGTLLDSAYDQRRNVVALAYQTAGGSPVTKVLASNDAGATWTQVLT